MALILKKSNEKKGQLSPLKSKVASSRPFIDKEPLGKSKNLKIETYQGVNQVLTYYLNKSNPPTYYVPCYIRMKVNRVSDINYIDGQASIESDIRLWVMLKEFPVPVQK